MELIAMTTSTVGNSSVPKLQGCGVPQMIRRRLRLPILVVILLAASVLSSLAGEKANQRAQVKEATHTRIQYNGPEAGGYVEGFTDPEAYGITGFREVSELHSVGDSGDPLALLHIRQTEVKQTADSGEWQVKGALDITLNPNHFVDMTERHRVSIVYKRMIADVSGSGDAPIVPFPLTTSMRLVDAESGEISHRRLEGEVTSLNNGLRYYVSASLGSLLPGESVVLQYQYVSPVDHEPSSTPVVEFAATLDGSIRAWSLTNDQRREYLKYYAPIIFMRAEEEPSNGRSHTGREWISNFDFDRDGVLATNWANWIEGVSEYVKYSESPSTYSPPPGFVETRLDFANWKIRPTLYTGILEYMEHGRKSVTLLYHVYHPFQGSVYDFSSVTEALFINNFIHDWERVEIRIDQVDGLPGAGSEHPKYAVVTRHSEHNRRKYGDEDLNFMDTATGRHVMVWQAEGGVSLGIGAQRELHWVEDTFAAIEDEIAAGEDADVNINYSGGVLGDLPGFLENDSAKNVHYLFVPEDSSAAVSHWNAMPINVQSAHDLASGSGTTLEDWDDVRRVTYELQDLADIFPTHWEGGNWEDHWQRYSANSATRIVMESAVENDFGEAVIPVDSPATPSETLIDHKAVAHRFFREAKIFYRPNEPNRKGYPNKHWFWGAYDFGKKGKVRKNAFKKGSPNSSRGAASGWGKQAHGKFWWQHDYFAHDGRLKRDKKFDGESAAERQRGRWLKGEWYLDAVGGFDGRWVQLFPDRLDRDEDGILDRTDNCVSAPNPQQLDSDADGVGDLCDNCLLVANGFQSDGDEDGFGNACDWDLDQNCLVDQADADAVNSKMGLAAPWDSKTDGAFDIDGDGVITILDADEIISHFSIPVGPSGFACATCGASPGQGVCDAACPYAGQPGHNDSDGDGVVDPCDNCIMVQNSDQLDADGDGFGDACDLCATVASYFQPDTDADGIGDACDDDIDADLVLNEFDNCPSIENTDQIDHWDFDGTGNACDNCPFDWNEDQSDADGDGVGDVCDNCPENENQSQTDDDGDGVGNLCDVCRETADPDQENVDDDGMGDLCDDDRDQDGLLNDDDVCPLVASQDPTNSDTDTHPDVCDSCIFLANEDQADSDGDYIGDACDNCPNDANPAPLDEDGNRTLDQVQLDSDGDGLGDACDDDIDADGVENEFDNCRTVMNGLLDATDQRDTDGDGFGDVCDYDVNNDGVVDGVDVQLATTQLGSTSSSSLVYDISGNGVVDQADLDLLSAAVGGGSGPSGLACAGTVQALSGAIPCFRYFANDQLTYAIQSCDELQAIADVIATYANYPDEQLDITVRLSSDIDCTGSDQWDGGAGFTPIRLDMSSFSSFTLDGDGYRVTHLTINRPGELNVGLFSTVDGISPANSFRIENLVIKDALVVGGALGGGWSLVGGFVASLLASQLDPMTGPTISNSHFGGTIQDQSLDSGFVPAFAGVGGLLGMVAILEGDLDHPLIERSSAEIRIDGVANVVGGLVADVMTPPVTGAPLISESFVHGEIRVESNYPVFPIGRDYQIGGIVGRTESGEIHDSYVEIDFFVSDRFRDEGAPGFFMAAVGGKVHGPIRRSYSTSRFNVVEDGISFPMPPLYGITYEYEGYPGEFRITEIADFDWDGNEGAASVFWDVDASGIDSSWAGVAVPHTSLEMSNQLLFENEGWDFLDVWWLCPGAGVPRLVFELDQDCDWIADADDNCVDSWNADQADVDGDGNGDVCDVACSDGLDNDGDGLTDFPDDPGCLDHSSAIESPQCDDGVDNDGDGATDFGEDPHCFAAHDPLEKNSVGGCGLGFEIGVLLVPLMWLRARRGGGRGRLLG